MQSSFDHLKINLLTIHKSNNCPLCQTVQFWCLHKFGHITLCINCPANLNDVAINLIIDSMCTTECYVHNYSWLSERERSYIGFCFKAAAAAAAAAAFSETSILNNFEVYTPFSKFCFL